MTLQVNGTDIGQIIEIAALVAGFLAMLIAGLIFYLMVRPPRHVRQSRKTVVKSELDPVEAEELWRLVDRMEARLEVLERALADDNDRRAIGADRGEQFFEPADQDRDSGRKE
jgi:hypothetical protein